MSNWQRNNQFGRRADELAEGFSFGDRRAFIRAVILYVQENDCFPDTYKLAQEKNYFLARSNGQAIKWITTMHQRLVQLYANIEIN